MDNKPASKIKAQRTRLGLNQSEFWNPIGITQSGGSRYEAGRKLPKTVQTLLDLRYGKAPLKSLASLRGVPVEQLTAAGK